MRLLLDTHVWIWSLLEPARLNRRARSALRSESNELWLSSISVWELLVLVEKGRLRLASPADAWVESALEAAPLREAPVTHAIARASRRVVLADGDPADRFIAATALVLDLALLTADARLLATPGVTVVRAG